MNKNIFYRRSAMSACFLVIIVFCTLYAERLGVPRYQQEKSLWCWAASGQMILDYYGIKKTQTDIVISIKGSVVNKTATEHEIKRIFTNNNLPAQTDGRLSEDEVIQVTDAGRPFVFGWYWNTGGGHALVFDGYIDNKYYVHDPWQNNPTNAYTYQALTTAGGKGRWEVSICVLKDATDVQKQQKNSAASPLILTHTRNRPGTISFTVGNNHTMKNGTIAIYNTRGALITTIDVDHQNASYEWNRFSHGTTAGSGVYLAVLNLISQKGSRESAELLFSIY